MKLKEALLKILLVCLIIFFPYACTGGLSYLSDSFFDYRSKIKNCKKFVKENKQALNECVKNPDIYKEFKEKYYKELDVKIFITFNKKMNEMKDINKDLVLPSEDEFKVTKFDDLDMSYFNIIEYMDDNNKRNPYVGNKFRLEGYLFSDNAAEDDISTCLRFYIAKDYDEYQEGIYLDIGKLKLREKNIIRELCDDTPCPVVVYGSVNEIFNNCDSSNYFKEYGIVTEQILFKKYNTEL